MTTSPPFPGGTDGVLTCVGTGEPDPCGSVLACYDESALVIAIGGYSDRRDQYRRRIQQHVVLSRPSSESPPASLVAAIVAAISSAEMMELISWVANGELSVQEFEHDVAKLVSPGEIDTTDHRCATRSLPLKVLDFIHTSRGLLCVEPGLSFQELWPIVSEPGQPIKAHFCLGAGIADPKALAGLSGVISTSKPLLHWGATAGQYLFFSADGSRSLHNSTELARSLVPPSDADGLRAAQGERRHRGWGVLQPAKDWLRRNQ